MKHYFLLCVALIPLACFGQYRGGGDDGMSKASSSLQNGLFNIYSGGSNDGEGMSNALNQNALENVYSGGSGDGIAISNSLNQNPLSNIYSGGVNDGEAIASVVNQNALPNIFTGGINDGTALNLAPAQNPLPGIYAGGANDGTSFSLKVSDNSLSAIYAGGSDDGFSIYLTTGQNPLENTFLESREKRINNNIVTIEREMFIPKEFNHFELERGINEALKKNKSAPVIIAYPNPSRGYFTLSIMNVPDLSRYAYKLCSSDGRIIKQENIFETSTSFDLSDFASANYYLFLFKDGQKVQHFTILLRP